MCWWHEAREREEEKKKTHEPHHYHSVQQQGLVHWKLQYITFFFFLLPLIAPPAETSVKENGEANGEFKETLDPNVPKKCDVIVISGRKERCDTALEALKVGIFGGCLRIYDHARYSFGDTLVWWMIGYHGNS